MQSIVESSFSAMTEFTIVVRVLLFPINRDKGHDEPSLCWQRCLLPVDSFLGLADFLRTTNKGRLPRYAPCKL